MNLLTLLTFWVPRGQTFTPDRDHRKEIAQWIVNAEARRDERGRIRIYSLPRNDGGGSKEYAGINDRYHPQALAKLEVLVKQGKHGEAEDYARQYIQRYVVKVEGYSPLASVDAFLCDCAFNRGVGGATKILQIALGVKVDGGYGPITSDALRAAEKAPALLITQLRAARETYERRVAGYRANLWGGLVNRWNKAEAYAKTWL